MVNIPGIRIERKVFVESSFPSYKDVLFNAGLREEGIAMRRNEDLMGYYSHRGNGEKQIIVFKGESKFRKFNSPEYLRDWDRIGFYVIIMEGEKMSLKESKERLEDMI